MRHKWKLSEAAGFEIPLDEAMMSWAVHQAEIGDIGAVDPAELASYWRDRKPVAEALAPPPIQHEKLEPLLSEGEQPLVQMPESRLAEQLHQRSEPEEH